MPRRLSPWQSATLTMSRRRMSAPWTRRLKATRAFCFAALAMKGMRYVADRFPDHSHDYKTLFTNKRLQHSSGKTSKSTHQSTSRKQSRKACCPTAAPLQDLLSKPILAELRKFSGSSSSRMKTWLWRWLGSMLSCWRKRVRLRRSRLSLELVLASSTLSMLIGIMPQRKLVDRSKPNNTI
jgi:hypothetical protein